MRQMKQQRHSEGRHYQRSIERRKMLRTRVYLGIMYYGFNEEDVLIGDGTVVDLSEGGVCIRGNCAVQVGMDLTLFLYLADEEDPLFILEATVAWTTGLLFGVALKDLSLQEGDRMRAFLHTQSVGQA